MKPWTRDNTKEWIHQVENRIEDFQYYLKQTMDWCEKKEIFDEKHILILSVMSCVWVSWMRDESITQKELFEFLGVRLEADIEDKIYEMNPKLGNVDHKDLLEFVYNHLPS